jgi:hypothetical protein
VDRQRDRQTGPNLYIFIPRTSEVACQVLASQVGLRCRGLVSYIYLFVKISVDTAANFRDSLSRKFVEDPDSYQLFKEDNRVS